MMLHVNGTGALLVVILTGLAFLMVLLLAIGVLRGSIKRRPGVISIGLVLAVLMGSLVYHKLSGGDFPRIDWKRSLQRIPAHVQRLEP